MRFAALLSFLLCLSAPASAQMSLGSYHVFDTRFGQVQVLGGDVDQMLWFDGQIIPESETPQIEILGGFARAEDDHDWVLVMRRFRAGNDNCHEMLFILRVAAGSASLSPRLGTCSWEVESVEVLPGRIEVRMSYQPGVFVFDGTTLTNTGG